MQKHSATTITDKLFPLLRIKTTKTIRKSDVKIELKNIAQAWSSARLSSQPRCQQRNAIDENAALARCKSALKEQKELKDPLSNLQINYITLTHIATARK